MSQMQNQTRRNFLKTSSLAAAALATQRASLLHANPLGLPLGIQLYSVREQLPKDYLGTLKQLSALGYQEVEAAGFFNHSPSEVNHAMQEAGLRLVSAHYPSNTLYPQIDQIIDFCHQLGLQYIVDSFPAIKNPDRLADKSYAGIRKSFLTEDWRYNAEQFNIVGEKVKKAGMHFAYHNHTVEFRPTDGVVPFDELMRLTDPDKVSFEMDCGWVTVGGGNPEELLHKYGSRIHMLHLKDFKSFPSTATNEAVPTEMGRGVVDNKKILAAAKSAAIQHVFVEQEGFDVPWVESLRIDADWLKKA